jgi:2-amino-4-hydroxy-6-hydroxymethyldihydropteridine diphosphokinase
VEIKSVTAYLGLGSNLGDRQGNLNRALEFLSQRLRVDKVSSVYDTEPVGEIKQPRFLNLTCQVNTALPPQALLSLAKGVEAKLGRVGGSGTPRIIDIDILFYGDQVVDTPELVIPHPRLTERAFVLIPLAEIAPTMMHPVNGKSVATLLQELKEGVQGVFKWEGV